MSKVDVFLSHKAKDGALARQLQSELGAVFPNLQIFLSEDIPKADDFRDRIWSALEKSRFFILLYTDPGDDWSWCFFEVGAFRSMSRGRAKNLNPIYCLHPTDSPPPSPLSDLQTIKAEPSDISRWLNDIRVLLKKKQQAKKQETAVANIEAAMRTRSILKEQTIKPYIWVTPRWPLEGPANYHAMSLPDISFESAAVSIDPESATQLGRGALPDSLDLIQLLRLLDCDTDNYQARPPYWMKRFFDSLTKAINGNLHLQEVAYFRHESGSIIRPIIVSVAKSRDGAFCRLKVLFIQGFGAPLADRPSSVQRLADGVRLGVRTKIEVINGFAGRLETIFREKIRNDSEIASVSRKYPIGRRVVEALETITEEARAHGINPEDTPPMLFSDADQAAYERIRDESIRIWAQLKTVAEAEDNNGQGQYPGTERLLDALKIANQEYLKLALPRLTELLAPNQLRSPKGDMPLIPLPPSVESGAPIV